MIQVVCLTVNSTQTASTKGYPPAAFCLAHTGIANNAENIFKYLIEGQRLEVKGQGEMRKTQETQETHILDAIRVGREDYSITVTGHSLGGGVAPLLAMKLKRYYETRWTMSTTSTITGEPNTNPFKGETKSPESVTPEKSVKVDTGSGTGKGAVNGALSVSTTMPEIRCFAYAPPGGLLSAECLELSKECVLSVGKYAECW